jgi:genome maintenance exonuclease 1
MADLLFREADHVYLLDGSQLPCVSDLCAPLHKAVYRDAPRWQLEAAAERGTAVHAATQALEAHGTAQIEEAHLPYLLAYKAFLQDHRPTWELTEQPLYHPEHLYAGTPDRYGLLSGKHTLVDVKTTYRVYKPLCRAQLNLYRLMLIARGYPVEKMCILHLKPDGTYKLIPIAEDEPLAFALITIHDALPKRRKKGDPHV